MTEIRHLLHINAPSSQVYKAITEETKLKSWWTNETIAFSEEGAITYEVLNYFAKQVKEHHSQNRSFMIRL